MAGFVGDSISVAWVFGLSTCITVASAFLAWLFLAKTNFETLLSNQGAQTKFIPQDNP